MEDKKVSEAHERISRRVLDKTMELAAELEAEEDGAGLNALPIAMITTGIMVMCRTLPADTVGEVLEALKAKVYCGDFTSSRQDG